jgi:hypothetical protein
MRFSASCLGTSHEVPDDGARLQASRRWCENVSESAMADRETPFDNLEGAHEYVHLLREAIEDARRAIQDDIKEAIEAPGAERRLDALRLVDYKLVKLGEHIATSSRILNDLRTLRRLLLGER